jgi:hypothetical protein
LTIQPRDDGRAVSVNAHSLYDALAEAETPARVLLRRNETSSQATVVSPASSIG